MNEQLQNKLYEKYPEFFENKKLGKQLSPMHYGIVCDDGWYTIIESVCYRIKKFQESNKVDFKFDQIKEKLGGLRLYYTGGDYKDYIAGVIRLAEDLSYKTCEVTGNFGELCKKGNWFKTLSPEKMTELGYEPYQKKE